MTSLIDTITTDWAVIKKDFTGFVTKVEGAVVYLEKEAASVIAWVDKADPALGAAIALVIHDGEVALGDLESTASAGLSKVIDAAAADVETFIANAIQASGLNLSAKTVLTAADVHTITAIQAAAHSAVDAGLAKLLGALAPNQQAAIVTGAATVKPPGVFFASGAAPATVPVAPLSSSANGG